MAMSEPAIEKIHPLRKTNAQLFEEVELLRLRVAELEDAAPPQRIRFSSQLEGYRYPLIEF